MRSLPFAALILAVAGCGSEPRQKAPIEQGEVTPEPSGPPLVQQAERERKERRLQQGEEEVVRIEDPDGTLRMSIGCTGKPAELVVVVPTFTPIGSEDRFALALGEEPVTLVADPTRQRPGAGVHARGPVPENFVGLLAGAAQVGGLYGIQEIGPYHLSKETASRLAVECVEA